MSSNVVFIQVRISIIVYKQCFWHTAKVFFYCAALWDNYKNTVLTQLHVSRNNVFRLLFR